MLMTRRQALITGCGAIGAACASTLVAAGPPAQRLTRGVILYPFDLSLTDWPERAAKAGLNTIALHAAQRFDVLADFIDSEGGKRFLADCRKRGIGVEYELHAIGELLSRELYYKDPTLFRLDASGRRNPDANCNPFSATALDIIAEKAVKYAKRFRPTTGRYFFWPDDGAKWDEGPQTRGMNASDQALLVENHILKALRKHVDPKARLSHISYQYTLQVPRQVKPADGVFVEFAPIGRDFTRSIADREAGTTQPDDSRVGPAVNSGYLDILAANVELFGAATAQVLEYWLDASLHSGWSRPALKLPWNEEVCRADVAAYRKLGLRHFTTFATYIDADYVRRHGDPQPVLDAYGRILEAK